MYSLDPHIGDFDATIEHFKQDISGLRTGRVNPSMVDAIMIDAYGVKTPLLQLASISCPEPRTIMIQPWDKSIAKDIDSALQRSDLGLSPVVDGDIVRLNFPPLTEEKRKELVKLLGQKAEEAKVSLKQKREKVRDEIVSQQSVATITEDDKFQAFDRLDKAVRDYQEKIKNISETKEAEIMHI